MNRFRLFAAAFLACALLISTAQSKPYKPVPVAKAKAGGSHRASHQATRAVSRKSSRIKPSHSSTSRQVSARHVSARAGKASRSRGGKRSRYAKAAPAPTWRTRQTAPTSDRYREIQDALASKGYLKSTPTGSWDADSQEALKRFQADQKLEQTGKLNSLSLIALGLGPAKGPEPAAAVSKP